MRLQILTALFLAILVFSACQKSKDSGSGEAADTVAVAEPQRSLVKKWETDTVLTTCESVVYDEANDVLYVSNIEGTPDEKDGKGSISRVGMDGVIITRDWITGLHAPKGMAISNGKLYVSDIDQIIEIDIVAGKIEKKYPVKGAIFLNDVAVTDDGVVLVSDSDANRIVKLENAKVSVYMDSVASPNGLFVENGKLLVAHWGEKALTTIDMSSQVETLLAEGLSNPDGIEATGDGGYLVSDWQGAITYVFPEGETEVLLDTRDQQISSADIEFIKEKNLLLIPTFFANKVVAYELVKE